MPANAARPADDADVNDAVPSAGPWGSLARCVRRVAMFAAPAAEGWRWLPAALALGWLPLAASYAFRSSGHQLVTGGALALLCLPLAWQCRWWQGLGAIGLTFAAHSALAIALAYCDPQGASSTFPDGEAYWHKQEHWITSGEDEEYRLAHWVPAHLKLAAGSSLVSFTSFGAITFHHGVYEVDLMNYYNGRLLRRSRSGWKSIALGWHAWSLLRGVGYTILSFEFITLSLQFFGQRKLAPAGAHVQRLLLGAAFLIGDAVVKANITEAVRAQLLDNMLL